MKTCPKCHFTLDAHCECPVCRTDITNVPYSQSSGESYAMNKYLIIYIFKYAKFLLLCFIFSVAVFLIRLPAVRWSYLLALICLIACFGETFFAQRMNGFWQSIYSESYLEATQKITKYLSGILAILIMLFF